MLRGRKVRWLAGVVAVGLLAGGVSLTVARASTSDLPPVPPDRLVASALTALTDVGPISGEVTVRLDLGIPQIVDPGIGPAAGPLASVLGDHRLRVWRSDDGLRVADVLAASERDLYVSRTQAWWWDWESFTAYRLLPPEAPGSGWPLPRRALLGDVGLGVAGLVDPLDVARLVLEAIDPSTVVSTAPGPRVAGRDAYLLTLRPRTAETLIGRIEVGVDAELRLPLRVAVYPRGGGSAPLSIAFTSVGFGPIDPGMFDFTPPPGATVEEVGGARTGAAEAPGVSDPPFADGFLPEVLTFGEDWATVVAVRIPAPAAPEGGAMDYRQLLPFSGSLFSVRLEERGDHAWLLFGAVPQGALARVAPGLS